jgi:serine/threonine-protein kinase
MLIRDKYQILERIGVGGMATVYKAKHLTFNEVRAIKVVSSSLMSDPDFLNRFKKEAIITRRLRHPNAVQLDDFDVMEDGRPFIVMEHVQGRNLRSLIHDSGPLAVSRALNLAGQVASALAAAHKLGIVHRDIKPDNILVVAPAARAAGGGGDMVKVLDFGIAKIRDGYESVSGGSATAAGMVVGTPQYVSPEQASGKIGDQIDGRSDLYSLGVVLYEMLTCRLPFTSETPVGYLVHHMHTAPTPPNAIRPDVRLPDPVAALLMKALEKDRNKRFQTADEMMAALSNPQLQARVGGWAAPSGPGAAPSRPAAAASSRPAAGGAAAAATVVSPQRAPARAAAANAKPGNRGGVAAAVATAPQSSQAEAPLEGTVFDETLKMRKPALGISWENVSRKQLGIAATVVFVLVLAGMMLHHSSPASVANVGVSTEDDGRILQDVKEAFAGSDALRRDPITPSVQGAVVTLSGKVRHSYESEIAQSLAANVDGVREVRNRLDVLEAPEQREQVWRSEKDAPPPPSASARRQAQREVTWGRRRMALRDPVGAEAAFRRALQADPSNSDAQQGLRDVQQAGKGR